MRIFPTEGPVVAGKHYCIPPLDRWDTEQVLELIGWKKCFVLHAPRQTGKTSALLALRDLLNAGGEYRCAYINVEPAQASREDVGRAMATIVRRIGREARHTLGDAATAEAAYDMDTYRAPGDALGELLEVWSQADERPLVLLIDEIDSLVGDTLVSVLRQLRAGYADRPGRFPQSVVLCGVRDVRDYRIRASSEKEVITGGSAFNVKAESLRLGDFAEADVRALVGQHTAETGQEFAPEAVDAVWKQTRGQPWLVNALAFQACFRNPAGRDRSAAIDAEAIMDAREELILRRDTHIHQLADKLREPRVRRVIEPMLSGASHRFTDRDLEYVRDLGLVAADAPVRIANPIYREAVPRELVFAVQETLDIKTAWYVAENDGSLDMNGLLEAFQRFFRANSEHWTQLFEYHEAGPQLLLQAFLQRVVNSDGRVEREYPLGSRRTDLLIEWPRGGPRAPRPHEHDRHVIELKVLRGGLDRTIAKGLEQTADYMDKCGAPEGHLVVFDRDGKRSWEEKVFRREEDVGGRTITVWGM